MIIRIEHSLIKDINKIILVLSCFTVVLKRAPGLILIDTCLDVLGAIFYDKDNFDGMKSYELSLQCADGTDESVDSSQIHRGTD